LLPHFHLDIHFEFTALLPTPGIFFFCMADTTPALNRSEDKGAWMIWVSVQPVFDNRFYFINTVV